MKQIFKKLTFAALFSLNVVTLVLAQENSSSTTDLELKSDYLDWMILVMAVSYLSMSVLVDSKLISMFLSFN